MMQMIRPRTLEMFHKYMPPDETSRPQPEAGERSPALIELSSPGERKSPGAIFLLSDGVGDAGTPGLPVLFDPVHLAARVARLRRTLPYGDLI